MASEDNFLRLDPYNFDNEEDYLQYLNDCKTARQQDCKTVKDLQSRSLAISQSNKKERIKL